MRTWQDAAVDRLIADLGAAPCCDRFDDHVRTAVAAGFITDHTTTAAAEAPAPAVTNPNT